MLGSKQISAIVGTVATMLFMVSMLDTCSCHHTFVEFDMSRKGLIILKVMWVQMAPVLQPKATNQK